MRTQQKSRCGLDTRAASKPTDLCNFTATRIKALIVRLALWGLIPFGLSVWLIQHGGLQDD
jgi:type IV secretory pathway TrbD component